MKPSFITAISEVLPKHMTGDRQARLLCAIINKTPKLANCTWASLAQCMIDCSAMGLEPDGRRAHLIPYGNTCTLIIDYKGLVELIYRSGAVDFIDAFCVYKNELIVDPVLGRPRFDVEYGANPDIFHKPLLDSAARGDFVGAYCVAHIKNITKPKFVWMTKGEIDAIRKRSKASGSGPWVTDYEEMAKKTTIRRISKTLPLSYEMNELLMKEVTHEHGNVNVDELVTGRFQALKPARPQALPAGDSSSAAALATAAQEAANIVQLPTAAPAPATEPEPEPDPAPEPEPGPSDEQAEQEAGLAPAPPAPTPAPAPAKAPAPAPAKAPAPAPAKAPAPAPSSGPAPASDEKIAALQEWCAANNVPEDKLCAWAAAKFRISPVDTIKDMADFAPRKVTQIIDQIATFGPEIISMTGGAA